MTVHQAKGLEFPFVFVGDIAQDAGSNFRTQSVQLEDELMPFRSRPYERRFSILERSMQDLIRFYYVVYSRAQHALVMLTDFKSAHQAKRYWEGREGSAFESFVETIYQ